jgi:hypothetical protein
LVLGCEVDISRYMSEHTKGKRNETSY